MVRRGGPPSGHGPGLARQRRIDAARMGRRRLARHAADRSLGHHAARQLLDGPRPRRPPRGDHRARCGHRRPRQRGLRPQGRRQRRSDRRGGDQAFASGAADVRSRSPPAPWRSLVSACRGRCLGTGDSIVGRYGARR